MSRPKSVNWAQALKQLFSPVRKRRPATPTRLHAESLDQRIVPTLNLNPVPGAADGATNSLRWAIDQANATTENEIVITLRTGATYTLNTPNFNPTTLLAQADNANKTGDLDIRSIGQQPKHYRIVGNNATIQQNVADRLFHIVGGSKNVRVTFENLTLTGGNAVDDGTEVIPFTVESRGGALLNDVPTFVNNSQPNITFSGVTIRNNTATGRDGPDGGFPGASGQAGLSAAGGAIYSRGGTIEFSNTTVQNNQALGGDGGSGADNLDGLNGLDGLAGVNGGAGVDGTDGTDGGDGDDGGNGGFGADGANAYGGAVYVVGGSVRILGTSIFDQNQAIGGQGGDGGNGGNGGNGGIGGTGGNGGNGGTNQSGGDAGSGGNGGKGGNGGFGGGAGNAGTAEGGGVYFVNGNLVINSRFTGNGALGGAGGKGGNGGIGGAGGNAGPAGTPGTGNGTGVVGGKAFNGAAGDGGNGQDAGLGGIGNRAAGGAVYIKTAGSVIVDGTLANVSTNNATGGAGGDGGFGGAGGKGGKGATQAQALPPQPSAGGVGGDGGDGADGNTSGEAYGGGIYITSGPISVLNSARVTSNAATGGLGGAGGTGGAAGAGGLDGGGTITSPSGAPGGDGSGGDGSRAWGGALYAGNGVVTIDNKAVVNTNTAAAGDGGSGFFQGNGKSARGGAVYVETGSVRIDRRSNVNGNQALGGDGFNFGAIVEGSDATGGGVHVQTGDITVDHTSLVNTNTAESGNGFSIHADGGGLYTALGNVVIDNNSSVSNNTVDGTTSAAGGGVWAQKGDVTVARASKVNANTVVTRFAGVGYGGGIWAKEGNVVIDSGSQVSSNTITASSGAFGGGVWSANGNVRLGPGVRVNSNSLTARLTSDPFLGSSLATTAFGNVEGGGLWVASGGLQIEDGVTIDSNTITAGSANFLGDSGGHARGAGVWHQAGGALTLTGNISVSNNTATAGAGAQGITGFGGFFGLDGKAGGDGGDVLGVGIYSQTPTSVSINVGLSGSVRMINNKGEVGDGGRGGDGLDGGGVAGDGGDGGAGGRGAGGGLYIETSAGAVNIQSVVVQGSRFGGGRGGTGGAGGTSGVSIGAGLAGDGGRGGDGGSLQGGGIYVGGGAVTLDRVNLQNNTMGGTGVARPDGGIGGSGEQGTGGRGGDGGDVQGGGLYAAGASLSITNSSFVGNGVHQSLELLFSPFAGNGGSAGVGGNAPGTPGFGGDSLGGGIYSAAGTTTIRNVTVSDNFAGTGGRSGSFGIGGTGVLNGVGQGGGIFVAGGATTITNSTIVENQSLDGRTGQSGGGIRVNGSLNLISSIVGLNNTGVANGTGSERDVSQDGAFSQSNNLIETPVNNAANAQPTNAFRTGQTNVVYATIQTASNGTVYHPLVANSPAINGGSNVAPVLTTDQIGGARQQGAGVDIGAVEFAGSTGGGGGVDSTPPSIPGNVSTSNATPNSIDVAWTTSTDPGTPTTGVSGYRVYFDTSASGSFTQFVPVSGASAASVTVGGLLANTTYYFRVSALDNAGNESLKSAPAVPGTTLAASTDVTPPSAPPGVTTSNPTTTSVTVSWGTATDNSGVAPQYRVYYRLGTSGTPIQFGGTLASNIRQIVVTGLTQGTTYQFAVEAVDGAGLATRSAFVDGTTLTGGGGGGGTIDSTPPSVPANVAATPLSPSSVQVTWSPSTDAESGVSQYEVRYRRVGETNYTLYTGAGTITGTSVTVTGLASSTAYQFVVRAVNGATTPLSSADSSPPAPATTPATGGGTGDVTPPSVPSITTATATGTTTVFLQWSPSVDAESGVVRYEVRYAPAGSNSYTLYTGAGTITGTSVTVTGLNAATGYDFVVRAVNGSNLQSADSPPVAATTQSGGTSPPPPGGVRETPRGAAGGGGVLYVAAGNGSGQVRVLTPGATTGTYITFRPWASYRGPISVAQGDVNGDGWDDIIVSAARAFNSNVAGDKRGYFGKVLVFDGQVAVNQGRAVVLRVITPQNLFGAQYTGGMAVASGDVDGDFRDDIVLAGSQGRVMVSSGAAAGVRLGTVFQPFDVISYNRGISVAVGDLDGDNKADIIAATRTGPTRVRGFELAGAGFFQSLPGTVAGSPFLTGFSGTGTNGSVAVLDYNGDGKYEIAVANRLDGPQPDGTNQNGVIQIQVYDRLGQLVSEFVGATGSTASYAIAGLDSNGDGNQELAVAFVPKPNVRADNRAFILDPFGPDAGFVLTAFNPFSILSGAVSLGGV